MKICNQCGESKEPEDFARWSNGYRHICKVCVRGERRSGIDRRGPTKSQAPAQTPCFKCKKPVFGYEPQYCCGGSECGCMGLPIEPPLCNECAAIVEAPAQADKRPTVMDTEPCVYCAHSSAQHTNEGCQVEDLVKVSSREPATKLSQCGCDGYEAPAQEEKL